MLDALNPSGKSIKILSVVFDTKLAMHEAVHELATEAEWRLRTLLRSHRFFNKISLVHLYKPNVLSFVEGATAAL